MFKHILIPVAPDHRADLDRAGAVARRLLAEGGQITVLSVLEPVSGYIAATLPEGLLDETRKTATERAHQDAAALGASEAVILTGSAGIAITTYAAEEGCDLIVISSHRPDLRDYFLGSTAARVIRRAQCSVHVLR